MVELTVADVTERVIDQRRNAINQEKKSLLGLFIFMFISNQEKKSLLGLFIFAPMTPPHPLLIWAPAYLPYTDRVSLKDLTSAV